VHNRTRNMSNDNSLNRTVLTEKLNNRNFSIHIRNIDTISPILSSKININSPLKNNEIKINN
jgi:hypothetical protein